jgi:uncharacterized protein YidB (DUF937 family)
MGILDDLIKQAANAAGGSQEHSAMATAVVGMLNSQGPGGLQALVQSFHDKGLGDIAASWVGTGKNLPVTPDQVHSVLGAGTVQQLAQQAGVTPGTATTLLAALLPVIVDRLTPGGQMPQQSSLLAEGLGFLKGKLSSS